MYRHLCSYICIYTYTELYVCTPMYYYMYVYTYVLLLDTKKLIRTYHAHVINITHFRYSKNAYTHTLLIYTYIHIYIITDTSYIQIYNTHTHYSYSLYIGTLLRGIKREDVTRGQVLAAPGSIKIYKKFEVCFY